MFEGSSHHPSFGFFPVISVLFCPFQNSVMILAGAPPYFLFVPLFFLGKLLYKCVVNFDQFWPLSLPCLIPVCLLIKSSFPLIDTHASYSPPPLCRCDLWGLIRAAFVSLGIILFTEAWSTYQPLHHWENEPHSPSAVNYREFLQTVRTWWTSSPCRVEFSQA